ncbi:DUF1731 domain-containing protein [Microbacteriaceae bacterium VKM Ac-2854]|nr:DUF1731 domain-containing protein [Microbacteriaceae bacterium VKM Ac-2854]
MSAATVVLAGASGFLGTELAAAFERDGFTVRRIGRTGPDARWGDTDAIAGLLDGADLLVNLAGKSVNCRYTDANRAEIFRSRLETTAELREAVLLASAPPRVWLNSSTATIYRHADDRPQTESTGEFGVGFSVDVARSWEQEFFRGELPATRRIALRMAIVLGDGPATDTLLRLGRLGLGGAQYDGAWPASEARARAGVHHVERPTRGRQRFSWVHVDDVYRAIRFLADSDLDGPVNIAAPNPSDNTEVMRRMRWAAGRAWGLPAARWMLEPAMWALRTESEMVLKSRWVLPERLSEAGFEFAHPDLADALMEISRA